MPDTLSWLTVGDQHGDVTGPARRTDQYVDTWFAKMEEVRSIAVEREVDAAVFTGDLIHRPNGAKVPYWFSNRVSDHFAGYPKRTAVVAGLGNHDIVGNAASWNRQPIGAIVRAGRLRPLWIESHELVRGAARAVISSVGYDDDQDLPERRAATYGVDRLPGVFHAHVVHTMLLHNGRSLPVPHTTPADILRDVPPDRLADLYVGGHVHDDLGLFGSEAVRCLNFGALVRGSIDEADLSRQVSVGLVEVTRLDRGYDMRVTRIPLKTARPVGEVFDLSGIDLERKRDERIERLVEALHQNRLAEEFRLVDPQEAAEAVIAVQAVPEVVQRRVRDLIDRAKAALS